VLLLYIVIAADETPILKGLNFADLKSVGVEKIYYNGPVLYKKTVKVRAGSRERQ
jgi:hypothetical protein